MHDSGVENKEFTKSIIKSCAVACNNISSDDYDAAKARQYVANGIGALGASDGLQKMLAAQMLSVHQLQQQAMAFANCAKGFELTQYFTNTAIKLANCFVQQANALSRLQGNNNQKITVERVDVHSGGQAIVGNVNGNT